jgi:hypothetical protein
MLACRRISAVVAVVILLSSLSACGNSPTAPPAPVDLTGTWSGQVGPPGSGSALRLTWAATQTGNVVSGIATLIKPAAGVQARGAMTGIFIADRLTLTYSVPPDSIQGFTTCEIAGVGNVTAATNKMTGTLGLMFRSCDGTGLEPPASNELTLTR